MIPSYFNFVFTLYHVNYLKNVQYKKTDNFNKIRLLTERKKKCYPKKIVCKRFSTVGHFLIGYHDIKIIIERLMLFGCSVWWQHAVEMASLNGSKVLLTATGSWLMPSYLRFLLTGS
jgi:hypothetical protein